MKKIYIHGLGQTSEIWNKVIQKTGSAEQSICPNLSEFVNEKEVNYKNLYQGFSDFCDNTEGMLDLCGLSLGGVLALNYAIDHPEKVHSLVLIGTQYKMPKGLLRFQNLLFCLMPQTAFELMGFRKKDFLALCRSMMELDFSDSLEKVTCYTGIMYGEKDKANKKASIELAERIQNARQWIIPNAGHEVNVDAPERLAGILSTIWQRDLMKQLDEKNAESSAKNSPKAERPECSTQTSPETRKTEHSTKTTPEVKTPEQTSQESNENSSSNEIIEICEFGGGYGWDVLCYNKRRAQFSMEHYYCGSVDMCEDHYAGGDEISASVALYHLVKEECLQVILKYEKELNVAQNLNNVLESMTAKSWVHNPDSFLMEADMSFRYYEIVENEHAVYYEGTWFSVKNGKEACVDFSVVSRILEKKDSVKLHYYSYLTKCWKTEVAFKD